MSQTYSIACRQCKCHLWIGQSNLFPKFRLYTTEKYTDSLRDFLWDHRGHQLLFDENCETEMSVERWTEIEAKSNPSHDGEKECGGVPTITWDECAHTLSNDLDIDFTTAKRLVKEGFHSVESFLGTIERDFIELGFSKEETTIILGAVKTREKIYD